MTRSSRPSSRDELLELAAVGALVVGERRAVDVQLDVVAGERHRGDSDVEALRRGVATEREEARPGTVARRRARELVEVDPVPDRAELLRGQRKRPMVDARDRRRDTLRRLEQVARAPVREPEDERNAQRAHERGGENGVDRAHVRDDGSSPQARKLARERGLEAHAAQRSVAGAKRAHAAVVGEHARNGAVGEHDDLVDEPASARIFGTVAASAG